MSERLYINDGWFFTEEFTDAFLEFNQADKELKTVRLPHTCKEVPAHYFDEHEYQMICGYKKKISVPKEWEGKAVLLTIDGAAHDSCIYVNKQIVAEHHCGYTAVTVDIASNLKFGEDNDIVIKVDSNESLNIPPFGFVIDYMTFGGIYRDVYIDVKEMTNLSDVFVRSEIHSISDKNAKAVLKIDAETSVLPLNHAIKVTMDKKVLFEDLAKAKQEIRIELDEVELWDINNPKLHDIEVELLSGETLVDSKKIRFGFRKAEFKKDGFYLNDKKTKIRGLNRHQSYPYVGYAMPKSMQQEDARILKEELGLNAVRTSHYPQSHYFIDKCDEIGLMVFTEIPGWQHIGDEDWKLQAIKNVKDMVLQYRNHTSIILWGVRINESVDDDDFYERTNKVAHDLDDSRPTGGVRCYKKSNLLEDVYTYNDFIHDGKRKGCDKKKDVTSDVNKPYLISEYNGHMFPTKPYDNEEHRLEHAMRHANVLDAVAKESDIAGSFGWCMFDYNTHKDFGSGDRVCYHGIMDMYRNPKMAAYVYESQGDIRPVLEFSSSMDIGEHPGCNRNESYIFTNADSVKMYKNDIFLKEYTNNDSNYKNLPHGPIAIDDYVGDSIKKDGKYSGKTEELLKDILNETAKVGLYGLSKKMWLKAGRLMLFHGVKMTDAVDLYNKYVGDWGGATTSYRLEAIKDGKIVKTLELEPMKDVNLKVKVSHKTLREENSYDVAAVRITAIDANGNQLYYFNDPVTVEVEGPVEIIGPKTFALNGGMGGTYIKTTGETGAAKLVVKSDYTGEVIIKMEVTK